MVSGLTLVAFALFLQTRITVDTGYGLLLPAFVLMGIGMALVMSPMSTAAMNSVAPEKAGVGSGILSMSRMVGATFGVAAIGALFQHLARNELADKLAGTGVSAAEREQLVHSLGAGSQGESVPPQVVTASHDAFTHAFANGSSRRPPLGLTRRGGRRRLPPRRFGRAETDAAARAGLPRAELAQADRLATRGAVRRVRQEVVGPPAAPRARR
jgi:hypothetical protein